jgi:hypothetical protein
MSQLIPKERPLSEQKSIAEELLSEAYARDFITMEEFENRISVVHAAGSNRDVQAELQDLPETLIVQTSNENTQLASKAVKTTLVLSSKTLRGSKLKSRNMKSKLILAEQKLDYSKTLLEPGKYYIDATIVLGTLLIIVPENYAVSIEMGSVLSEIREQDTKFPGRGVPEIVVRGKVILGEVKVKKKGSGFIDKIKKLLDE